MNANNDEVTVTSILAQAKLAGLPLTEDEASQVLTGVRRNRVMAQAVRSLLTDPATEPATVFTAQSPDAGGN